jgi:acyl-CoA dehydrogenase
MLCTAAALRAAARRAAPVRAAFRGLSTAPTGSDGGGFTPSLSDDQKAIMEAARAFAKAEMVPVAAQYDRTGEYPHDVFKKAWAAGLVNMHVPVEYGGAGLHALEGVIVAEELAYGCSGMVRGRGVRHGVGGVGHGVWVRGHRT